MAISVLGLTTNVFQIFGLPIFNGIFTGVGMTIAARNLFELATFYFVNWRVDNSIRRINQEISNILGKEISIRELGKLSLDSGKENDVFSLIGDTKVHDFNAYLLLREDPVLRYIRAISEKTVAQVVHSNKSLESIMDELKNEIQGIAVLFAVREHTLYVEKRHVNLAKQLIYQEIAASKRRSKVWAFIKWLSAAILGFFVGFLGYNVAKNCWHKDCSIFDFSKHNNQNVYYVPEQSSNENLANYLTTQPKYVVPIEECKEYTKKFVEFLVNNKDKLVHKTFRDIVTEFNGGNDLLNRRLIEGFNTNTKLSKVDIEKLINVFGKGNGETLAYHLHRVMGAKDALQMPSSDTILKEVADSFNHAKLSPNEETKWKFALNKLKEVVNQKAKGKFEVSMSDSVLRNV
ncbi:MAG: hypothetical protein QXF76_00245 [Candidatus Anstonellales archaeon]